MSLIESVLTEVEKKIHDCEALKNFDRVKAEQDKALHERDEANRAHEDAVRQIAGLQNQLSQALEANRATDSLLAESRERERALETKSAGLEAEARELKEFKALLLDAEGLTLDEVLKRATAAREAEIARRVSDQVEEKNKAIEADLPRLAAVRLHDILNNQPWPADIQILVQGYAWGLLMNRNSWPKWFNLQISNEVNTRVQADVRYDIRITYCK